MTTKTKSCSFINPLTRRIAQDYLSGLDSPTSLGIWLCLENHDDISACSHSVNPLNFLDNGSGTDDFGRSYLASMLLSKFRDSPEELAKVRETSAVTKFWDCERHLEHCYANFHRLFLSDTYLNKADEKLRTILSMAREEIRRCLGSVSAFKIDDCNFGPGSSSSVPRAKAHPSQKYVARDVSRGCAPFVENFLNDGMRMTDLVLRESSRISIVPKNFKSDRVIAIEPDWNIFFQKGIGKLLRRCLRKDGLDLDNAAATHGDLARLGSIHNTNATIDLSSASDSIATYLVRYLLPDDWFYVLNSVRTNCIEWNTSGKKTETYLRKFSSMGNGFTFELETLIFRSIAISAKKYDNAVGPVSVFGDDIIAPRGCIVSLIDTLQAVGFKINLEKSFTYGGFRESCGYHFFRGRDFKPFFLRENVSDDFQKFKVCNAIRYTAYRFYGRRYDDTPLHQSYDTCKRSIRRIFRIPAGYGDGGLVCSADESRPSTYRSKDRDVRRYPSCIEGYKVRCLLPIALKGCNDGYGMHLYKLRALSLCDSAADLSLLKVGRAVKLLLEYRLLRLPNEEFISTGNEYSVPGVKPRYRVGFIHVPQWCDPEI